VNYQQHLLQNCAPGQTACAWFETFEAVHAIFLRPFDGADLTKISEIELRVNSYELLRIGDGTDLDTGERIPATRMLKLFNRLCRPADEPCFIDLRERAGSLCLGPIRPRVHVDFRLRLRDDWRGRVSAMVLHHGGGR
jgi:hypothetical protein